MRPARHQAAFPDTVRIASRIGERVLDGCALRLAAFEFRAPSVKAVFVFLDQHTGFADHEFSLLCHCTRAGADRRPNVSIGPWTDPGGGDDFRSDAFSKIHY